MENKTELYKAISNVMKDVKGIDKSMTVGSGNNSYKAVSDKDVKTIVGKAMEEYGLIMIPKEYKTDLTVDRWEQNTQYGNKMKQSVFVECKSVHQIIHVETGQSIDVPGYGHGIDSQDKAAGKATTYAMKNAILYSFFVPTGSIDDTDKEHSESKEVKPAPKPKPKTLTPERFEAALDALEKKKTTVEAIEKYALTEDQKNKLSIYQK